METLGENEGLMMEQGLTALTGSADTWERQQLPLSPSPYMWHSSGHLPLTTQDGL